MAVAWMGWSAAAHAEDVHVGPTASGTGDGHDWDNQADWASVSLDRGNQYFLAGGTYGGRPLATPSDGTPIVIRRATSSAHGADAGWVDALATGPATFADGALTISSDDWIIDGVTGGGPGQWRTGHGFLFTSVAGASLSYVDMADGVANVVVRHAAFTQTGDTTSTSAFVNAFSDVGELRGSTFEYCYIHDISGLPFFFREGSGNIVQYNYLGDICGVSVHDVNQHCEGVVIHGMSDMHFRWNYVAECPSSGGFVKNDVQTSSDVRIYGNTFSNGFPINCNTGSCVGWRVLSNTFHDTDGGPFGGDGAITDLLYVDNVTFTASIGALPGTHASNWFSRISANSCDSGADATENVVRRYPSDCDVVTETQDPFVNSSGSTPEEFELAAPIVDWSGQDVCALDPCVGERRYDHDAFGRIRGADGTWDRGAYEIGPVAPDAGVEGPDGSATSDAGVAGADSGSSAVDGGASAMDASSNDGGTAPSTMGACRCVVGARGTRRAGALAVSFALALGWLFRRRARPKAATSPST